MASAFVYSAMASLRRPSAAKVWARVSCANGSFGSSDSACSISAQGFRRQPLLQVRLRAAGESIGGLRLQLNGPVEVG